MSREFFEMVGKSSFFYRYKGGKGKVPKAPPPTPPTPTPREVDEQVKQKDKDRRRQRINQSGRGGTILTQGQSLSSGGTILGRTK